MPQITDYDGLKQAVTDRLTKSLSLFNVDLCIQETEARINRTVRHLEMETEAIATLSAATLSWPLDFGGLRFMEVTSVTPNVLITQVSPGKLAELNSTAVGTPVFYSMEAEVFRFWPSPTSSASYTLRITYYKKVPSLTELTPTNWFLTDYPDVYISGVCWRACMTLQDWERAQVFKAEFAEGLSEIRDDDKETRWGGGPLVMRPSFSEVI